MNLLSPWRSLFLVLLILVGLIYAAPNLYGEDPAIQIATKNSTAVSEALQAQVKKILEQHQIPVLSAQLQNDDLLVRLSSDALQLQAQDFLKAELGGDYVIALNLAPRTPHWLQALGAFPMKLGLDLRGGINLLLHVDTETMLAQRENSDVRAMGDELRGAGVRYASIASQKGGGIALSFRAAADREAALNLLKKHFANYQWNLPVATPERPESILQAVLAPGELTHIVDYAVDQNILILNNRVNELGVAEAVVQRQGADHISVDLPGIQDMARAKDLIGKVAQVKFFMVDLEHDAGVAARTGAVPLGSHLFYQEDGQPLLLKDQVVLSGDAIINATAVMGDDGHPAVSILLGSGVSAFHRVTAANIGKPMATVYFETRNENQLVDGKLQTLHRQVNRVISVATIQSALASSFQILHLSSQRYANDLALQLRSGAFSAPVEIVQDRLVGPTLGAKNIQTGILSTEIGTALVLLFMAIYYRVFGLFADLALVLNIVFVVAILSILGATLTLPGIAGIILTVGMAVDANVLINERIREELRLGVGPQASIHAGYERAFSTIVDANVSTLIVAAILFALGSGTVKSFAVTLAIGLLTSMVTAIFFTRTLVNAVYGQRKKKLSIGM